LRVRDHRLELEVRSVAGDLVTEILVAAITAGVAADVTRVGEAFLVAYAGPEANGRVVNASRVHCHD
jgi:hypothetical protein